MSRPATRVLALLEVLQDRGLVAADELAERLAVDTRSVRRYATALREMGIPIETVRGRYGGYRLARGYRMPPLMLADDEAVAVAVALAAAGERQGTGAPSPTDRALVKLTRVLPVALRSRVTALLAATGVVAGSTNRAGIIAHPGLALALAAAITGRRRVRITHAHKARDVDPYGLVVHARAWYLVGHDHLRDAIRIFRVDRITEVAELPDRFTVVAGFDPVAHVTEWLTFGAWTHRTEVWLDTDATTARLLLGTTAGTLEPCPDGGVLLVSGAENLPGMARVLAGLPWRFTVIAPPALADALTAHVAALTEAAARSGHQPPG